MGLGLLFIGYVFVTLFTLAPTYFLTDLVGSFIIYEALVKLRRHAEKFRLAMTAEYVLFAVSAVQCVYYSLKTVGMTDGVALLENVIEIARLAAILFFTVTMLAALSELAESVGDRKLSDRGKRCIWYCAIGYFFIVSLYVSQLVNIEILQSYVSAFAAFTLLLKLLCPVIIAAFIYSCYMWICLESDHDMTPKPSKLEHFLGLDKDKSAKNDSDVKLPEKSEKHEKKRS